MRRNYGINQLKFIATIAVVVQHLNGQFINYENTSEIFGQNILSFSSTFAVPVFFVISGYFYKKSKNTKKNIIKNFTILLTTYIIYLILNYIGVNVFDLQYKLITVSILWYLKVLVLLQLLFIIRNTYYIYAVLILSLIIRFAPYFDYHLGNNLISSIPFFTVGMLISIYYKNFKNNTKGILITILGYVLIFSNANFQYTKMSLYMLLCASLLFIGVLLIDENKFKNRNIYNYSLWIYLTQMLLLPTIRNLYIFDEIYSFFGNYVVVYELFLIMAIIGSLIVLRKIIAKIKPVEKALLKYGV